ncbi:hypothetical protein [Heyndrickxia coagulans]
MLIAMLAGTVLSGLSMLF